MPQELATQGGAPRSGRGKQLTAPQEAALIRICQARRGDQDLSNHTKSFWKSLSTELMETTGRVYSWQSCRRQMLARETDRLTSAHRLTAPRSVGSSLPARGPDVDHAPVTTWSRQNEHLPANCQPTNLPHLANESSSSDCLFANRPETGQSQFRHSSAQSNGPFSNRRMHPAAESRSHRLSISHDHDPNDDTDDEMLPEAPIPPLQRALRTIRETEKETPRAEIIATFQHSLTAFETQLQRFTNAGLEDEEDRQGVTKAFHFFRDKVNRAIARHNL